MAKAAYEEAVQVFKTQFTNDQCKQIWLHDKHGINDVQKAVLDAKASYEGSKQTKVRIWLGKHSSRMMPYGTVLDMLAQHHSEYVSLAWGAIKFIFMVSLLKYSPGAGQVIAIIFDLFPFRTSSS